MKVDHIPAGSHLETVMMVVGKRWWLILIGSKVSSVTQNGTGP